MKKLLLLILCCSMAQAQNWPSFRGPRASGVVDGTNPPIEWDAEKQINIKWKTAIPGLAHSSPVVWGNRLFVTTAASEEKNPYLRHGLFGDGDEAQDFKLKHQWKLYCLDKRTGKILWERVAHEGLPKLRRHIKSTHANSTPVTDGKYVVAFFGSEGLYCYDTGGKLLWKQDVGFLDLGAFNVRELQWGAGSSPIIYKNLVIIQNDARNGSFIAAFDIATGKQVWRTVRDELPSWGTPTVYEGKTRAELIANGTNLIAGYDPATGKELWRLKGNSLITCPTPVVAHDLIFVTSGYRPIKPIYAIRAGATGDISLEAGKESNEYVAWSRMKGGPYQPTPIVYGDYLYTNSNNGVLACYNARTGELIYEQRIAGRGGSYSASPVAADGRLYLTSEDGEIFVVRAGPKYELLATNKMGEVLMATPAISDGMIIVRGRNHLFAIADNRAGRK
ncbi:MAG: PQQ-binding-like beta-propeller repeat protein [Acidobacteriota bacterium]